jgi:hypothetical protein
MTLRSFAKAFLGLALGLPVVSAVLVWVTGLLRSMGDDAGAAIIGHLGTALHVTWSISLVALVISLALVVLAERPQNEE